MGIDDIEWKAVPDWEDLPPHRQECMYCDQPMVKISWGMKPDVNGVPFERFILCCTNGDCHFNDYHDDTRSRLDPDDIPEVPLHP